jgi:hypothetical protein
MDLGGIKVAAGSELISKIQKIPYKYFRSDYFFFTYFLICCSLLVFYYRQGGPVDAIYGPAIKPGMRDVGIYIQAAQNIVQGVNPYNLQALEFRSGAFGVLIFAFFGEGKISFITLQVLNLVGPIVFTYALLKSKASRHQIFVLSITSLWFSCSREILSTGQITGILMGLIGIGYTLIQSKSKVIQVLGALPFAIVLDLKPHVFLLFIIALYVYFRRIHGFFIVVFHMAIGHMFINFYCQTFIEDDWLKTLFAVSDTSDNPQSSGSRTIWPVVRSLLGLESVPSFFPIVTFLTLGILVLIQIQKVPRFSMLYASLLVPVTYSYFHLYSFLPIAIFLFWALIRLEMPIFLGIVFSFLTISGSNLGIKEALISLAIFSALMTQLFLFFNVKAKYLWRFTASFITIVSIRYILNTYIQEQQFWEVININFLVVGAAVTIFLSIRRGLIDAADTPDRQIASEQGRGL